MFWRNIVLALGALGTVPIPVRGQVGHNETEDTLTLTSSRLNIHVNKTLGAMTALEFDSIDILGPTSGRAGMGYFDCFCVPSVSSDPPTPENPNPASSRHYYVGQSTQADYTVLEGEGWVGLIMSETYAPTGQFFQQWWFLRDGETGYHSFVRLQYTNESVENIGNLQEFRQVITPNSDRWTHLITNSHQLGHLPSRLAIDNQVQVQDATWYYNISEGNPYKEESSDYFTKYQWADLYGDHKAHGFYADGSNSNGTSLGFWTVFSNLEGYTGGPLRSDLVVDTNLYNYYASNHRGSATMNITTGFDRIFGPSYIHLNRDGDVEALLADAESYANSSFAADFYDEIAGYIPGYTPSSGRGDFNAVIDLPTGAGVTKAVLSQNKADMQDNVDYTAGQYWVNVTDGLIHIPRVKADTYRLTIYAEGVFGQYEQDDVEVKAGDGHGDPFQVVWDPESHGTELWRLGTPDKTAGEFRHGFEPDLNHTLNQDQYRQYWGAYDFPNDFPQGVNFTIGVSDPSKDWNYVHYSRFGGTYTRPGFVLDNVNVWTLNWTPDQSFETDGKNATMTVQLAGARTPSGNLDLPEPSSNSSDLDLTLSINSNELVWTIPYNQSSSCSDRSGIACYNIRHLYSFPADWLKTDEMNVFEFILPYNASGGDTNFRNYSVSVMYDAIRLEIDQ